ncbi:MAG TPA: hypothetical protein VIF62_31950 [Labilithrix sp.]|jgi:hypothetical protein
MDDDLFDEAATRRVANRALVSAALAFFGGIGGNVAPLAPIVVIVFLVVAILVGISAIVTLNHPEARVLGGVRHLGIVLGALGALLAAIGIVVRVIALVHG